MDKKLEELEPMRLKIERHIVKIHFNSKVLLDPYTNFPYITAIIDRKLATQHQGEREYKHPDGMWQYFKARFFPDWVRKKYPIKMKVVVFSFRAIFPKYQPPPEEGVGNWMPDVSMQGYKKKEG